jgi:hypothetical protein
VRGEWQLPLANDLRAGESHLPGPRDAVRCLYTGWGDEDVQGNLTMVLEVKNTFCRNVTIYGHCRYENSTSTPLLPHASLQPSSWVTTNTRPACPYIHDVTKLSTHANENMQKSRFTGDSPAFTPLQAATNGTLTPGARSAAISPKAAKAAVFTPKSQRSGEFVMLVGRDRANDNVMKL